MAIVSDPGLIAKIEQARGQTISNGFGVVSDETVINKLDALKAKNVEQEEGEKEENETSVAKEGSVFGDALRVIGSIGSSIVAEPAAGLYGIATMAGTLGDADRASASVQEVRDAWTYRPETVGSQEALQSFGELLTPIAEGLETVSSASGDAFYEWTGSPALAAAAYSVPTLALELIGLKGVKGTIRLKDADLRRAQKEMLLDPELKYSGSVAEVKLNKKGQLVEDKAGTALVKNGIRPNDTAIITNSTPATKKRMGKMVEAFEDAKGNDVLAISNKTTQTIGVSVTSRLQALQARRKAAGERLEAVVDGDLGGTPVDITSSLSDINAVLEAEGIVPVVINGKLRLPKTRVGKTGKKQGHWSKGTVFEASVMAPARRVIEDVYKLFDMKTMLGATDLKHAHNLKKNLDELVDAAKLAEAGVSGNTIRAIAGMRKQINDLLGKVDAYGAVNRELSEIIEVMKPFGKHLKQGEKWSDAKVSSVVGERMKTLSADSASAVELVSELSDLEKTLRRQKIPFPDDPRALIVFRETLLENFNLPPAIPASQAGSALTGAAASMSIGNTFGAAHDVARLVRSGMDIKKAKKLAAQNKKAFNIIKMAVNQ